MAAKPLIGLSLNFMGDSKTALNGYQATLKSSLISTGNWEVVNSTQLAVNGWTVNLLAGSVTPWLATDPAQPQFVLLNIGINDAGFTSQASFEASLGAVLDGIHTKWPGTQILLMRVWGRSHDAGCDLIDDTYIPNVLSSRGPWAAVGPDERIFLKGSDNGASTMEADGIHPNATGYALTAAAWKAAMGY